MQTLNPLTSLRLYGVTAPLLATFNVFRPGAQAFAEVVKTSLLTTSAAVAGHARLADANNLLLFFVFPLLSLFLSLSPRPRPTGGKLFSIPKARHYREKKLCFLWTELELAARGGTRKPPRRATRKRRPMDVHVFVSLTQRLGFGHQSGPKFPFGKPHDQKSKKKIGPLSQTPIYFCFDDLYVL